MSQGRSNNYLTVYTDERFKPPSLVELNTVLDIEGLQYKYNVNTRQVRKLALTALTFDDLIEFVRPKSLPYFKLQEDNFKAYKGRFGETIDQEVPDVLIDGLQPEIGAKSQYLMAGKILDSRAGLLSGINLPAPLYSAIKFHDLNMTDLSTAFAGIKDSTTNPHNPTVRTRLDRIIKMENEPAVGSLQGVIFKLNFQSDKFKDDFHMHLVNYRAGYLLKSRQSVSERLLRQTSRAKLGEYEYLTSFLSAEDQQNYLVWQTDTPQGGLTIPTFVTVQQYTKHGLGEKHVAYSFLPGNSARVEDVDIRSSGVENIF